MAVTNSLTTTSKKLPFSKAIETDTYKNLINSSIKDEKARNRFITAVMSAVSANPNLQKCDAATVLTSALQGEALELSPSPALGQYAIVPYGKKWNSEKGDYESYSAQFQIMTNGRVLLAMRSGQFAELDVTDVREGEFKGFVKGKTKAHIEFIEDAEERENKKIVGYYAYFTLNNGFSHSVYLTKSEVISHAKRYSKAFNYDVFMKVQNGEKLNGWKEETAASSPWIQHFDAMASNLALRRLLKRAPMSIEMRMVEESAEKNDADLSSVITPEETANDFFDGVDESTGEVIEAPKKPTTRKKKTDNAEEVFFVESK